MGAAIVNRGICSHIRQHRTAKMRMVTPPPFLLHFYHLLDLNIGTFDMHEVFSMLQCNSIGDLLNKGYVLCEIGYIENENRCA